MSRWQVRLAIYAALLLIVAVTFAVYVWHTNENRQREARIQNCIAVNELSRKLYITMADLGIPEYQIHKFRPTRHCEDLP